MWGVKDVVSFTVIDGDASLQTDTDREGHRCGGWKMWWVLVIDGDASLQTDTDREGHRCGEFSSHWREDTECFNHWHSICSD